MRTLSGIVHIYIKECIFASVITYTYVHAYIHINGFHDGLECVNENKCAIFFILHTQMCGIRYIHIVFLRC